MDFFDKVNIELDKKVARKIIIELAQHGIHDLEYLSYPNIEVDTCNVRSYKIIQVSVKVGYLIHVYLFNLEGTFITNFTLTEVSF